MLYCQGRRQGTVVESTWSHLWSVGLAERTSTRSPQNSSKRSGQLHTKLCTISVKDGVKANLDINTACAKFGKTNALSYLMSRLMAMGSFRDCVSLVPKCLTRLNHAHSVPVLHAFFQRHAQEFRPPPARSAPIAEGGRRNGGKSWIQPPH